MNRLAVLLTFALICADGQATTADKAVSTDVIERDTDRAFGELLALRRDLHAHPEPSGQEVRTAAVVAARLRALGLEVRKGPYGHSLVAILRGGKPGRTVAWRSELDALTGYFLDPVPFRSRKTGVHHACGHDVHIAIAVGIAEVLTRHRAQLHGNAVFIFQPEEENVQGAKAMVDSGLFTSLPVDEIYGLHVTGLPVGQIAVRPGEMFAYQRRLRISLKDTLAAADLQQLGQLVQDTLTRNSPLARPWEIQRLVDPEVGVMSEGTAFQDYLIMDEPRTTRTSPGTVNLEADLYETSAANLASLLSRVTQIVKASGHEGQLLGVSFAREIPTVFNDAALTRAAVQIIQRAFGPDAVRPVLGEAPFFNDDFAYFQQRVPGVFFFLGGSNPGKGLNAMNHSPDFAVDEDSIRTGVRTFSALISARLGE
jgi:metal-dependent amidase/aminoacylase/carboxypeptidase family protein